MLLGLSRFKFVIWRFFKDKRGQMQAIDFAIALSIFLIAFSQVLGMAVNSVTTITEQTTQDHVYIAGNSLSTTLLDSTGGFDWNDISSDNLRNANGQTLGLANASSNSPSYALHPNALARLDPGSPYYLPIIDETQYGIPDPYYDSSHHTYISTSAFNAHNASNIPYGERFYFGLHSVIKLSVFNITDEETVDIIANVTDEGRKFAATDIEDLRLYVVAPDGTITEYDPSPNADGDYIVSEAIDLVDDEEGRYAIVGIAQSDVGNWDYRVLFYDHNPTDYTLEVNATLLQDTSSRAHLYAREDGQGTRTKTWSLIFWNSTESADGEFGGSGTGDPDEYINLGVIPSTGPVICVVNVKENGESGVGFTALPLLFDSDLRFTHQPGLTPEYIRPIYGISPTESTVYAEYIHNYVSVRGMIFEATVCYWRR